MGKDRTFDDIEQRRRDRWNFLFIAGMWFQDLFNYDFRRTEQCIIPYATEAQHDLDRLGIAKNAREEKIRARDARLKERQEQERMMKLYREHVLKEQPGPELVQIGD